MRTKMLIAAVIIALTSAASESIATIHTGMADGLVTKIDVSAGKITMRHGPLKKLDMELPMTMVFRVQDPAMLKAVKVGDQVKFDAERVNGQITVTKIEKAN